ncbi:MAG: Glu/Leu/Phe/Val dehydrogenase [Dehalococcoidia bacterium]|nr:Glu/Leu/Phe/Val dehydrogenase [Dehalococcoidia bacterium]
MAITETMAQYDYEQLLVCVDKGTGLKAFIAVHDTTLGPSLGGCRIWPHKTEEDAITDVLRLARGMTYKNSAAGLHLGGGKALIWADPRTQKNEAMLRIFARYVDTLGGRYITTEDVGSTTNDMVIISQVTSHVTGLPRSMGGSGDPSDATGLGIYRGMLACVKEAYFTDSMRGMTVAIQGFGKVAGYMAEHLKTAGAHMIVTDINKDALKRAAAMGCEIVEDPEAIYDAPCQVFSPCALGATMNSNTIPRLKCKVIAGSANNQLATAADGDDLHKHGILYAPDYVINAGGVINISHEIGQRYSEEAAREHVMTLYDAVAKVISVSKQQGIPTARAADFVAEERIRQVRASKPMRAARYKPA